MIAFCESRRRAFTSGARTHAPTRTRRSAAHVRPSSAGHMYRAWDVMLLRQAISQAAMPSRSLQHAVLIDHQVAA